MLFLLPDLSIIGYIVNVRWGAITYNAIHTYVGPFALAGYSFEADRQMLRVQIGVFEMRRILQAEPKHAVKADVSDPNERSHRTDRHYNWGKPVVKRGNDPFEISKPFHSTFTETNT